MSMQEVAPKREDIPREESFWTARKVDDLRRLVADGLRGTALQQSLGCSLGALYGKIRGLGISMREQTTVRARRKNSASAFSFTKQTLGDPVAPGIMDLTPEPSDAAMSLADLDDTRCHWPISGAGLDMMFCGERANECGPYCARHHSIAYRGRRNA